MTAVEAAKVIGCHVRYVRLLVQLGKFKAEKKVTPIGDYWDISADQVEKFRDTPQECGFPRGHKRPAIGRKRLAKMAKVDLFD